MLELRNLRKSFGALTVTNDVSLKLSKGERHVILGPNGAGKTTLFNLLVGELRPNSGQILLDGRDVSPLDVDARARLGMSRSYQRNNLLDTLTVRENLCLAACVASNRSFSFFSDPLKDPHLAEIVDHTAETVDLTSVLDERVDALPYGNRRQLEVGLALATRPKLLLMDEPTSGVGPNMIDTFHALINNLPSDLTVLIIEHDMDLAFDVADQITVLNYGEVVFAGTPQDVRESTLVREIYLGTWGRAHA